MGNLTVSVAIVLDCIYLETYLRALRVGLRAELFSGAKLLLCGKVLPTVPPALLKFL